MYALSEPHIKNSIRKEENGCWTWLRNTQSVSFQGKMYAIKKLLFTCHYDKVPILRLRTTCDNNDCVNPEHLEEILSCPNGHVYNENNIYITQSGARNCKLCRNYRMNKKRQIYAEQNPILNNKIKIRHKRDGRSKLLEHNTYLAMINRCYNKNEYNYKNYGARGITVCDAWRNGFWAFYKDMGPKPSKDHQLDRINNNGNYEPSNCRWASRKEQMRNFSRNKIIQYKGISKTLIEWAEDLKIGYTTILHRLESGWSVEDALTKPKKKWSKVSY